jgi:hypothetical protein
MIFSVFTGVSNPLVITSRLTDSADAVPTVAGSHMTLFRPSTPRIPGERGSVPGEVRIGIRSYRRLCCNVH